MSGPTLGSPVATGTGFTTHTTPSPPPLSDIEARHYYYGLPSKPPLVARTGSTPWEEPSGPEAYLRPKELGVASRHKINEIWEDVLAPKVFDILKKGQVDWTSIDIVRIGYVDEYPAPVVLWIGINPNSQVSYKVHYDTAMQCKKLLIDHDIEDIEVEMRQSQLWGAGAAE